MKDNSVIIQNGSFQGNLVQGNVSGDVQFGEVSGESEKDLCEAAGQIQYILEQLDNSYPSNTVSGKMQLATKAVSLIENDQKLQQRILSALKVGSISALEQLLSHPAASFVIAAIQDWKQHSKP
jgi:hypothetical protein